MALPLNRKKLNTNCQIRNNVQTENKAKVYFFLNITINLNRASLCKQFFFSKLISCFTTKSSYFAGFTMAQFSDAEVATRFLFLKMTVPNSLVKPVV
jgi:hypothetical protein